MHGPTLLVAPWALVPHPDHEACGRAVARLAQRFESPVVSYFFWSWQYKTVESLLGLRLRRLELEARNQASRDEALLRYRSQQTAANGWVVLSSVALRPARRPFETFIVSE